MTLRPEAIERMARAMRARDRGGDEWDTIPDSDKAVWRGLAREALDALLTLLAERGCRVVGPNVTEEMVIAALDRHQGPNGSLYGTIFTAMLARSVSPLSAEDPAHG